MKAATNADDLALLLEVAAEAGAIAMRYFRKDPQVWMKTGDSPVSEADYAADKFLRETLLSARPDYGWLSEETTDDHARLSARRVFVVDPIDGTRDFIAGGDQWCVSVAVVEDRKPVVGVLQCPARKQRFWASAARGSFLDGARLKVTPQKGQASLAGPAPMVSQFANSWPAGISRVAYVPSLAYRVAMIAAGTFDATFIRPNAHDWDIAAAQLILEEAGGIIVRADGQAPLYAGEVTVHPALAAGSGELVHSMQSWLAGSVPG